MTSFSIIFSSPESYDVLAGVIPRMQIVLTDYSRNRIDVKPCSIMMGEMTRAPCDHILLVWSQSQCIALPLVAIRSIIINE